MRIVFTFFILMCCTASSYAQQKWNLRTVVEHAMANNFNVRINEVQVKNAELTYRQSQHSQIPSLMFSGNTGVNSGSNQDPVTFDRITQTYLSAGMQLQSSVEIFNFFRLRNSIEANRLELEASKANVEKWRNDIALTAANAYLNILLSIEQMKIMEVQLTQSRAQLSNTRRMVDAGMLPELDAAQMEVQYANDSVTYITAKGTLQNNILALKAAMNIDADAPFEVEEPNIASIPVQAIADLLPDAVYQQALQNQPLQKYNSLKLLAAEKNIAANRAAMLPSFALFGSLGSSYNNKAQEITGSFPVMAPIGNVDVGGTNYTVFPLNPFTSYTYGKTSFPNQIQDNFRQSLGLSVSIPIFNGSQLRTNYERSKLNSLSLQIQKDQDDKQLKQDIYNAYNAAMIALEKFNASSKAVEVGERAYNFASRRYDVGMLGTLDLITSQNNLLRAKLENKLNQFDYVFKMKVLEFYKGRGISL